MRDAIFNGYPVQLVETVDEIHSLKEKFTAKVSAGSILKPRFGVQT